MRVQTTLTIVRITPHQSSDEVRAKTEENFEGRREKRGSSCDPRSSPPRRAVFHLTPSEREELGTMMGCSADLVEKWICEHKGASDDHRSHTPWAVSNQ